MNTRAARSPILATALPLVPLLATLAAGCATRPAEPETLEPREASVPVGINESWKSDDIEPLVARLESESREIYDEREALAAVVAPPPGATVADVGAGSGFMAFEFAQLVGPAGTVYAVDINPVLMEHVASEAERLGHANVETIVCGERSVDLPPGAVDVVFICDTYHHFEYPRSSLRSIHEALRPGGEVVLVEFKRIPGVSRPFIIEHVRAGRAGFIAEFEAGGFDLVETHDTPFLQENYVLRFRKR